MTQVSDEIRARNRKVWSAGNWDEMSHLISSAGSSCSTASGWDRAPGFSM